MLDHCLSVQHGVPLRAITKDTTVHRYSTGPRPVRDMDSRDGHDAMMRHDNSMMAENCAMLVPHRDQAPLSVVDGWFDHENVPPLPELAPDLGVNMGTILCRFRVGSDWVHLRIPMPSSMTTASLRATLVEQFDVRTSIDFSSVHTQRT
eukprot:SAG11_NODE_80_length_17731_cov_13.985254_15_plen_149_part_00